MTRRSASAKDHLHHPRGKHGREGRRSLDKFLESPELPAAARNFWPPEPPAIPELPALPAHNHLDRGPCTLLSPRLYILLHLLLVRVSVGLAHLRDRATLIHIRSPPCERLRPLRRRSLWIQDLLAEKNIKTSSRRRPTTLVSSLVDCVPCELYVSEDLAHA